MVDDTIGQGEQIIALWIGGQWKRVYTTQQIATELNYNPEYIAQLCKQKELIAYKVGNQYFIPPQKNKNFSIDMIPF